MVNILKYPKYLLKLSIKHIFLRASGGICKASSAYKSGGGLIHSYRNLIGGKFLPPPDLWHS